MSQHHPDQMRMRQESCSALQYSRFNAQNIAHTPCLIPVRAVGATNGVDVVHTDDPFFLGELDLSGEVVHVTDQRGQDLPMPGLRLWAHEIYDMLCEVGVEFVLCLGVSVAVGRAGGSTIGSTVCADSRHFVRGSVRCMGECCLSL